MLDFQRGPKPRNFLSRREQRRLLFLVLTLGLVLFLVFEARKPKYYQWIVAPDRGGEDPPAVGKASSDDRQIDTRQPLEADELAAAIEWEEYAASWNTR